MRNLLMLP